MQYHKDLETFYSFGSPYLTRYLIIFRKYNLLFLIKDLVDALNAYPRSQSTIGKIGVLHIQGLSLPWEKSGKFVKPGKNWAIDGNFVRKPRILLILSMNRCIVSVRKSTVIAS